MYLLVFRKTNKIQSSHDTICINDKYIYIVAICAEFYTVDIWKVWIMWFILSIWMINKTYPPLLASHQGQVKIKSSPLGMLVSKMKPIMTTVIGHPQKKSCMMRKTFVDILLFIQLSLLFTCYKCMYDGRILTKYCKAHEKRKGQEILKNWRRPIRTNSSLF